MIGSGAFWTTLARAIREERKVLVEELAKGNLSERTVGKIHSLDWVLDRASGILGDKKPKPAEEELDDAF